MKTIYENEIDFVIIWFVQDRSSVKGKRRFECSILIDGIVFQIQNFNALFVSSIGIQSTISTMNE